MEIAVEDWGLTPYEEAWQRQTACFEALVRAKRERRAGQAGQRAGGGAEPPMPAGRIILCEHPPVYTLGRSGREANLLVSPEHLRRTGATLFRVDRGGDITYHGPGQVVCYPILDLEALGLGLRAYIHCLEEAVIRTCADYGVRGERIEGATGVWVTRPNGGPASRQSEATSGSGQTVASPDAVPQLGQGRAVPRKVCAIGVRASHSVTMHGLALNVSTDLSRFLCIHPCGFTDRGVTSLCVETGRDIPLQEVKQRLATYLQACLQKI